MLIPPRLLTIKGAPDVLIERCSRFLNEKGFTEDLTAEKKEHFEKLKNDFSSSGKRCILLARKIIPSSEMKASAGSTEYENALVDEAKSGLTLVGLVAILDPLRPEIREVVRTLRGAGVRIAMV